MKSLEGQTYTESQERTEDPEARKDYSEGGKTSLREAYPSGMEALQLQRTLEFLEPPYTPRANREN